MTSYLLDTNVVSELRKPRPNAGLAAWWERADSARLYLSALTVGEIQRGITKLRARTDHPQADLLDGWLSGLADRFGDRILPVSTEVALAWGRLRTTCPLSTVDGLLAATAQVHRLTVVTRNGSDFAPTRVRVTDPFR